MHMWIGCWARTTGLLSTVWAAFAITVVLVSLGRPPLRSSAYAHIVTFDRNGLKMINTFYVMPYLVILSLAQHCIYRWELGDP